MASQQSISGISCNNTIVSGQTIECASGTCTAPDHLQKASNPFQRKTKSKSGLQLSRKGKTFFYYLIIVKNLIPLK